MTYRLDPTDTFGTLRRLYATEDIPLYNVKAGDRGGWVADYHNLLDGSWVADTSRVHRGVVLKATLVKGESILQGDHHLYSSVLEDSDLYGNYHISVSNIQEAYIYGRGRISDSNLSGYSSYDNVQIYNSEIHGEITSDKMSVSCGLITDQSQIMTVGPIGSEDQYATIYRNKHSKTPQVTVGCWTGDLHELPAEVDRRINQTGYFTSEEMNLWTSQYNAFYQYATAITKTWRNL